MKLLIYIFLPFITILTKAQENPLFDEILRLKNQNLNLNYDTTVILNHKFKEIIFDKDEILYFVDIDGISYELGRYNPLRNIVIENRNYKKYALLYDSGKNIHYRDAIECNLLLNKSPKVTNNYLQQKHNNFAGASMKFTPPLNLFRSPEVLSNTEIVTDTVYNNQECYVMKRVALVEYLQEKEKKKPSDYRLYVKTFTIVNKSDYATVYYQFDNIIAYRDSSHIFKIRTVDKYEKINNKYYRSEGYNIIPRYMSNHKYGYNSKGLYTLMVRESKPFLNVDLVNSMEALPPEPYKKFCKKIDKVPDEGIKIYEEAKRFINEPLPSFGELEKYWEN